MYTASRDVARTDGRMDGQSSSSRNRNSPRAEVDKRLLEIERPGWDVPICYRPASPSYIVYLLDGSDHQLIFSRSSQSRARVRSRSIIEFSDARPPPPRPSSRCPCLPFEVCRLCFKQSTKSTTIRCLVDEGFGLNRQRFTSTKGQDGKEQGLREDTRVAGLGGSSFRFGSF